jgi:RNA polymerase sigma factor (sigma-70 family)
VALDRGGIPEAARGQTRAPRLRRDALNESPGASTSWERTVSTKRRRKAVPDDAEMIRMVRALQQHEPGSLDVLLATLRPALLKFLARSIGRDDAEDWTQVALIRMMESLPAIDPERAGHYVERVAWNLIREARRYRAQEDWRASRLVLDSTPDEPLTPEQELELDELARAARTTLPPKLGDVMQGVLEGLSPSHIAHCQHLNPVTTRTRLHRARTLLRQTLVPYTDCLPKLADGGPARPRTKGSPPPDA